MKNRIWHLIFIKKTSIKFLARLLFGGIFIYASVDKIAFSQEFVEVVNNYRIIPPFFVKSFAIFLPWVELIFGIFLVVGIFVKESAFILSGLLIIFMIVLGVQATQGPIQDCGCFPRLAFISSSKLSTLMIRDGLFLILGIFIFLSAEINLRKKIAKTD